MVFNILPQRHPRGAFYPGFSSKNSRLNTSPKERDTTWGVANPPRRGLFFCFTLEWRHGFFGSYVLIPQCQRGCHICHWLPHAPQKRWCGQDAEWLVRIWTRFTRASHPGFCLPLDRDSKSVCNDSLRGPGPWRVWDHVGCCQGAFPDANSVQDVDAVHCWDASQPGSLDESWDCCAAFGHFGRCVWVAVSGATTNRSKSLKTFRDKLHSSYSATGHAAVKVKQG